MSDRAPRQSDRAAGAGGRRTAEPGRQGAGTEGGWEAERRRKLTAGLAVSPAQRLAWLEEAIAFAHRAGALPQRSAQEGSPSRGASDAGPPPRRPPGTRRG
jgi:hypothetical protein